MRSLVRSYPHVLGVVVTKDEMCEMIMCRFVRSSWTNAIHTQTLGDVDDAHHNHHHHLIVALALCVYRLIGELHIYNVVDISRDF